MGKTCLTYHIYISHYVSVSAKTIKKHIEFEDGLDQTTLHLIKIIKTIYISYLPIVHHDSSIFDLNEGYLAGLGSFGVTLTVDHYCHRLPILHIMFVNPNAANERQRTPLPRVTNILHVMILFSNCGGDCLQE